MLFKTVELKLSADYMSLDVERTKRCILVTCGVCALACMFPAAEFAAQPPSKRTRCHEVEKEVDTVVGQT